MSIRRRISLFCLLGVLAMAGCTNEDAEIANLHQAQRDFWRARHAAQRLDIYPNPGLVEESLTRFRDLALHYPADDIPLHIDDPDSPRVKTARVGAMASLEAAALLRELGRSEEGVELLERACRPDLPLGQLVERRVRRGLADLLCHNDDRRAAIDIYLTLFAPIAAGLPADAAARPDEELLELPVRILKLARAEGDSAYHAHIVAKIHDYLDKVVTLYPDEDAAWLALLVRLDIDLAEEYWGEAVEGLQRIADLFPEREPWRAELRRARLLANQLGRLEESRIVLRRWLASDIQPAVVEAARQYIRLLLESGQLEAAEQEILAMKQSFRHPAEKAELLFLRGMFEIRREAWEDARAYFGQAASDHPYTAFGLAAQYKVAEEWADRGEVRFTARALERLFNATRRNTRNIQSGNLVSLSLEYENRADSLLGTLSASDEAIIALRERRAAARIGN
ncbi:MAG: hypothetical protein GY835_04545 [bacterium]|nr:hypothetical protein [bacterium]